MNNINFILVFFLMLSNINCNIKSLSNEFDSSSNLNTIDLEQRYPFVKMKRTPCFGKCPYYEFVIFSNGDVLYEGFNFVEKIGKFEGEISIKKIAFIKEKLKEVEFFNFDSVYDAGVSDLPSTIIEVNLDNKKHRVKGRYRMPEKFKYFSKFIDEIINEIQSWEKL